MKLVCFSNNTAGGLLCDLLNKTKPRITGYKTNSTHHCAFKVGDTPSIQTTVDTTEWYNRTAEYHDQDCWFGTHVHPSAIPNICDFEQVITITTCTRESKLFRWLRYYHGWFKTAHPEWVETASLEDIDKIRILAKNVFDPFLPYPQSTNVEFSDIVSGKFIRSRALNEDHFAEWKAGNPWLYCDHDSWATQRFNEADWEVTNKKPFKYI